MLKLKPCPFCGKQPEVFPEDPKTEGDAWTKIACVNERCGVFPEVTSYDDIKAYHRRNAARRWNTRRGVANGRT
jgi:restriction alleviation protein Lar